MRTGSTIDPARRRRGRLLVSGRAASRSRAQPKPQDHPDHRRESSLTSRTELTLKLNEPVIFRLTTVDVVMGFSVPDFAVRGTIIPGQTIELPMTPTKIGEFTFLCDVFCGSGHENMEGTMRVVA